MTISEQVQNDYKRWHHFLEQELKFSLSDSEKHTKEHCARVLLFALLIADKMDLSQKEREALCAAAVFHDSRRQDDWLDVGHGQRAADYYRDYCQTHSLSFDNRVYLVMAFHDRDDALGEVALAEQYAIPNLGKCPFHQKGQVLYSDGINPPDGMCGVAWQVIGPMVRRLSEGQTVQPTGTWLNEDSICVFACPDGIRPVIFLLEAQDNSIPL